MKNKKNIIIFGVIAFAIIVAIIIIVILKNSKKEEETFLFPKDSLIEDYYVINDYNSNSIYENKIFVPNYMTKVVQESTMATYKYNNGKYNLWLQYNTYKTEKDLNSFFIDGESFNKKDFYYLLDKDNLIKVYFQNENGYYQAIEIRIDSSTNTQYSLDSSYENLFENLSSTKKSLSDYAIKKDNGFFLGSISYNKYNNESDKIYVKADYKVSAEKYGTNYDADDTLNQKPYFDNSSISFYEGKVTADLSTVKAQTRVYMNFVTKSTLDNLKEEAVSDLKYSANQTAFNNATENNVRIDINSFDYNDKEIKYVKIDADNNNSHSERINAYYPVKADVYYVVIIYGGDNKRLDIDMVKDFLPINVEVK